MQILHKYCWDVEWEHVYRALGIDLPVGRITGQYGRLLKCLTDESEILTEVSGRLSYGLLRLSLRSILGNG